MGLNIAIIIIIGLLGYWYSSQGFLSGLLHLVCVICAASLAFAWWEPIVVDNMLNTSWWSGLMPGFMLLTIFVITLAILRMASDKLAFGNTRIPRAIDVAGGAIMGALSGVLTAGVLLLGNGFVDQTTAILGMQGWRAGDNGTIQWGDGDGAAKLWLPVDSWTVEVLETLSLASMHPDLSGRPLARWNPELDRQAWLLRDRLKHKSQPQFTQMIQPPDSITVDRAYQYEASDGSDLWVIPMSFKKNGMDFGGAYLAMKSSHLRLVGDDETGKTRVYYPRFWGQQINHRPEGEEETIRQDVFFPFDSNAFMFDNRAREEAYRPVFNTPSGVTPRFVQVRGTRFDITDLENVQDWEEFCSRAFVPDVSEIKPQRWGGDISTTVSMRGNLPRGASPSPDHIKGRVEIDEDSNRITRAEDIQINNSVKTKASSKLRIRGYGIITPTDDDLGTKLDDSLGIVKIEVGPGSEIANLLAMANKHGQDGDIVLIDANGTEYVPQGYEMKDNTKTYITFNVAVPRWRDIRRRPRRGTNDILNLIFIVPVGTRLDHLLFNSERLGFFENVIVEPPSMR